MKTDSFLKNHLNHNSLASTTARSANDQNDSDYHSFARNQWQEFKEPMPPSLMNGSKRVPNLIPATQRPIFNRKFNQPQQTINPIYSQYGEPSELSNFKSIPELYHIGRNASNNSLSHSNSSGLVNGHEKSIFSSSNYGGQRYGSNHSNISSTPCVFENSNVQLNGGNSFRPNSFLTNVSRTCTQRIRLI